MTNYGLGFDTGGTYTDAVIIDMENGSVVCSSKSLTTRNDLSLGIKGSIEGFDSSLFENIKMVSLSSTLATNSIVEGKGCRVALIAVGREFDRSIHVDEYVCIKGGHNLSGQEKEPLDIDAAKEFLKSVKNKVDGIAITSYLSVRNPEHENRLYELTKEMLDVPVVCGHELSSSLGYNERTVTCIMNARLIPIIKELIVSVKKVMEENGIKAPLMIVKGDGSIMGESVALHRPIETILSGPAASLIGAKNLTGVQDAIVMDMGGTTTDIGILRNGTPRLEKEGAIIGGKRTRVLAAEIATSGIGGDSRIVVNGNELKLTSLRVVPLCIAASKWPHVKEKLKEVADAPSRFVPACLSEDKITQENEFFIKLKDLDVSFLTEDDVKFLETIVDEPKNLTEISEIIGVHPYSINIPKMEELGMIQRIGLTPTDLLHGEGSYVQFDAEGSMNGIIHQAKKLKITPEEFIVKAKDTVITKISTELLKKLFFEETKHMEPDVIAKDLMNKAISGKDGLDYGCRIKLNKPIIGIGAPVSAYFPKVAEIFDTELLLSEYSHVGNAVGAITGNIIESIDILIVPFKGEGAAEDPRCTLFASFGKMEFEKYSEAIEYAKQEGAKVVGERALAAGADKFEIKIENKDKKFGFGDDYGGSVLIESNIIVTAVGKPKEFRVKEKSSYYSDLDQKWDV
ncbi:MAG: hydantoinase/oxoprolinase family protein [Candidatus Methanomethylophilaceae archaeon]|nr:hydantoinase/oxoprolinase family protein [Candidatus Methanomethylophilaceae archaeon]